MDIHLKSGEVHCRLTAGEAEAIRACLYREGKYPSSPSVQVFRRTLYDLLHVDCKYCGSVTK